MEIQFTDKLIEELGGEPVPETFRKEWVLHYIREKHTITVYYPNTTYKTILRSVKASIRKHPFTQTVKIG